MFLLETVPLVNIPLRNPQTYSYYFAENIAVGSIVLIPIRNRTVEAVAVKVSSLESQKMALRKSKFVLKSISQIVMNVSVVSEAQIELAYWMSEYYHFSLGKIFKAILPKYSKRFKLVPQNQNSEFRKQKIVLKKEENDSLKQINFDNEKFEMIHLNGDVNFKHYSFIADKIAKKNKQVLFLVPESFMVKSAVKEFSKYFDENFIVELHAGLNKTIYWQNWHKIKDNFAKIIIGTRSAIFSPFDNIGAIIIKDFFNISYKQWDMNPKYDIRDISKYIAGKQKIKLFINEVVPSISSSYHIEEGNFQSVNLVKNNSQKVGMGIINMGDELQRKNFSIISGELQKMIEKTLEKQKKVLLFINRRGTSTFIICYDCGYVEKCPNCDVPLTYHVEIGKKLYCHHCGYMTNIFLKCPKCAGTNLKYFGTGSEKVENEVKKLFPQAKIMRIDSDTAKNPKEQEKIYDSAFFENADIFVGTQMIIKKILPKVDVSGIISVDNMLNLPSYDSEERVFRILLDFKRMSKHLIIQTYTPDSRIFKIFKNNNIKDFYKEELGQRKMFHYPPFSRIVKLVCRDKQSEKCKKSMLNFLDELKMVGLDKKNIDIIGPAPAFLPRKKGLYEWHIILKLLCPDYRIRARVFSLIPAEWEVDVNPESLL